MPADFDRRDFLRLAGVGAGVVVRWLLFFDVEQAISNTTTVQAVISGL